MSGENGRSSRIRQLRAPREVRLVAATLHVDGTAIAVRVRNISAEGLMAADSGYHAPGTAVVIELPEIGAVPGRVAWALDDRVGIALDRAIDPRDVPDAD
jgi:hypothetical protein